MSGALDRERMEALLAREGGAIGAPLVVLAETASTNDDAKAAARAGAPHGAAFVADRQTRGRGRMGHAWHSPPGESLYASWVLRPSLPARLLPPLTLAGGLAVVDALRAACPGVPLAIKWPNDVLVAGRKLAGVLVEALLAGDRVEAAIVGIGVNVHARAFPPELAPIATSLAIEGMDADRADLFARISASLARRVAAFEAGGAAALVRDVRPLDALAGRAVTIEGAAGVARGIDDDGRLLVEIDGDARAFGAGEVSLGTGR